MNAATVRIAVAALVGAAGCASYDGRGLVPGRSSAAEVEAQMGPPAERLALAGGESVWFYPRQPFGLQTFAVRMSADGRLLGIEPRLTEANLARIVAGSARREDVRALLGPPFEVGRLPRQGREVWAYRMETAARIRHDVYVQFSDDGVVREVLLVRDVQNEIGAERD
ncbi:MAG: outer membrane protein assembly factor BamE [Burkholderiales bacterium]|nr:outer membrane protein assembly factor BamE [Burkholderiales bacterium]